MIYWNNQPSPYFVRRMNALHDRGNIAIEAWFSQLREPERDWIVEPGQWRFPARMLPSGSRRLLRSAALLRSERPDLFVTLYGDYAFAITALAAKACRVPVVIHAMRTFASWRRRSLVRETAKHVLFRIADAVQASGPDSREYATAYGATPSRVFALREEVDVAFWAQAAKARESAGRALRSTYGLTGCIFLYVGRLWKGKGIASLIEAYDMLRAESIDCSLVLVGTGPEGEHLREQTRGMHGVVFAGHTEGDALKGFYSGADVFVFPTLGDPYGHVVQEAMASRLPVISTTAAGDIADRVVQGKTGYLVAPDDSQSLASRMRLLATDAELRVRLGDSGRARIQDWSTELWAIRFEEMVFAALQAKSRL